MEIPMENTMGNTLEITIGIPMGKPIITQGGCANMEYVTRTTNTVTMNTDCAYLKHNHRDPETIKKEMENDPNKYFEDISRDKVLYTLIDENHKTYDSLVNEYFKDANRLRNEAQIKTRHKERCHRTYCSSWKADKKKKSDSPVMEIVLQVGGIHDPLKDYATGHVDPAIGKKILIDFVNQFIKKYPLLKVIDVSYHQSEATPHIHLDFIPIAKDEKYGKTASLDKACEQMGFGEVSKKDPKKTVYHIKYFEHDFHKLLDDICLSHGIEIDHPKSGREHETVKEYKRNEKLRQDNAILLSEKSELEAKKKTLSKEISEHSTELENIKTEIKDEQTELTEVRAKVKERNAAANKLAAELTEGLALQDKLTADKADLVEQIADKQEELQSMSVEQYTSDLFVTLSNKLEKDFHVIGLSPTAIEAREYTKDDFKKQAIGNGYIVPEDDLERLLKYQYNFRSLIQMIEDRFKSLKSYIKKICEQIYEELVSREKAVTTKEKEIAPAYDDAIALQIRYKNLIENAETEIRHEATARAKIMVEEMFDDPDKNTRGARALKYLDEIGYLDEFEKKERILAKKAINIDWN